MVTVDPVSQEKVRTVGIEGAGAEGKEMHSYMGAPECTITLEKPDSLCPAL